MDNKLSHDELVHVLAENMHKVILLVEKFDNIGDDELVTLPVAIVKELWQSVGAMVKEFENQGITTQDEVCDMAIRLQGLNAVTNEAAMLIVQGAALPEVDQHIRESMEEYMSDMTESEFKQVSINARTRADTIREKLSTAASAVNQFLDEHPGLMQSLVEDDDKPTYH